MWSPIVTGGNSGDGDPLDGRVLQAWTWPFGFSEGPFGRRTTGSGLENDALASPEGVERTDRAVQESLRLLYVGCTRAKNKLIFVHRNGKYDWLSRIAAFDILLDASQGEGEHPIADIDTTLVIRELNAHMVDDCRCTASTTERWISVPVVASPKSTQSRFYQPSQVAPSGELDAFTILELPGSAQFPSGAKEEHYADIGNAVHAYFAAIPSMRTLNSSQKNAVAERCLSSFSVSGLLAPSVILSSGDRFCAWVDAEFPGARWHTEVPVTVCRNDGGHWNGAIDLLLELTNGEFVVIDHKSAPIRREHCFAKAATFSSQLNAYREMMTHAGDVVASCWIHFPLAGVAARQC